MNKKTLGRLFSHTPMPSEVSIADGLHYFVLYALIRMLQPRICVEIGSYKGNSAAWIAQALEDHGEGQLVCIDPFIGIGEGKMPTFWRKLEELGLSHRVRLIEMRSSNALVDAPKTIDFLFIDGDHTFEGCSMDIENYVPRLSSGGVVVFHDYQSIRPVKTAVMGSEILKEFVQFPLATKNQGMYVAIKP